MDYQAVVEKIRRHGFAILEPMGVLEIDSMSMWLAGRPYYANAHVPETARKRGDSTLDPDEQDHQSSDVDCICVETADVIIAPHFFERALACTDLAAAYLGRDPPVLFSANAFWTMPGPTTRPDIQDFHRDFDDERFLALFVYLTDVEHRSHGPHELKGPDGLVRAVYGRAGTVFVADTSHEHRGIKPVDCERGIAWFRWGVSDRPPAGVWDKIEPIPAAALGDRYPSDQRLRESIKLLVSPL